MTLIERTRYLWAALLGLIAGPAITFLGNRSKLLIDARTCLSGAFLGIAMVYLCELHTGRSTHRVLQADALRVIRAMQRQFRWLFRALTPKRSRFRYSLRTWFVIVAAIGLAMGWIGHNLHRNLKRDELASNDFPNHR